MIFPSYRRRTPLRSTNSMSAATASAIFLVFWVWALPVHATHPGINGLVAYTDLVDADTPLERRAVFIDKLGQFTHPRPLGANINDQDSDPAWSPNGQQLVFVRLDGLTRENQIFVVQADGSGMRRVFGTEQLIGGVASLRGATLTSPSWETNGYRINFYADQPVGSDGIWTVSDAANGGTGAVGNQFSASIQGGVFDTGRNVRDIVLACAGAQLCLWNAGATQLDLQLPGTPPFLPSIADPNWWPNNNRFKYTVAVSAQVYRPAGGTQLRRTREIYRIDPLPKPGGAIEVTGITSSGDVTCTVSRGGVSITRRTPQYEYADPAPSPDGKFLLVHRTTNVPIYQFANPVNPNSEDDCGFTSSKRGIYLLRATGALQSTVVEGEHVADAAWQSNLSNLAVHVTDGHGNPLDGLKLELLDFNDPSMNVGIPPGNDSTGTYTFKDVLPGSYIVRATLVESGNAFDIRHDWWRDSDPFGGPVWIDRRVDVSVENTRTEIDFPFADTGVVLNSNISQGYWDRLDDMAAIYYQTHRFVKWVRENLTQNTGPKVPFYTFATTRSSGASVGEDEAFYVPGASQIFLGTGESSYESRDGAGDNAPVNSEWHEFTHHLFEQNVTTYFCPGEVSHGGYSNYSTCNSLHEGFASFLPTQFENKPDYAGMANLEDPIKAWGVRFSHYASKAWSLEDFAVAALFWDIVDSASDAEYTLAVASNGFHVPVTYADNISIPLQELWQFLVADKPINVLDLQGRLDTEFYSGQVTIDLDADGVMDVNAVDPLFLMHGFFPIIPDQIIGPGHGTYHFDVAGARLNGPPGTLANNDVGFSSHYAFDFAGQVSAQFLNRQNMERAPEANLDLKILDASGTPLYGADVELTIASPDLEHTTRYSLGAGDDSRVHLELPTHFEYLLPEDAPIPDCDPATDRVVDVTVRGSVNGYASLDAPTFDNCEYLQGMIDSSGAYARSVTLNFPEDSMPPVTTIEATASVQPTLPVSQPVGTRYTTGFWTVEIECEDPVDGDFASGCWRREYSLDNGPFVPYEEAFELTDRGLHRLDFRSMDAASNSDVAQTLFLGVTGPQELTPPVTTLSAVASVPAVNGFTEGDWTVSLTCDDATGGGCQYSEIRIDGGPTVRYEGPVSVGGIGSHVVEYQSTDLFFNREPLRSSTLRVVAPDTQPPATSLFVSASGNVVAGGVMGFYTVRLSSCYDGIYGGGNQAASGCALTEVSLDGGPFAPLGSELIVGEIGAHTVAYRSIDAAGNVEAIQVLSLTVIAGSDVDGDGVVDPLDNCPIVANSQEDMDDDGMGDVCDLFPNDGCSFNGEHPASTSALAAFQNNSCEDWSGVSQPGADLRSAMLRKANLSNANLGGTDLSNADLSLSDLSSSVVAEATYNESTIFPSGNSFEIPPWGLGGGELQITPWDMGMVPTPEPSAGTLLCFGAAGLIGLSLRKRGT